MNFLPYPTSGLAFRTKVSLRQLSSLLCNAPFAQVPLAVAVPLCSYLGNKPFLGPCTITASSSFVLLEGELHPSPA